jgi:hypothetical protein
VVRCGKAPLPGQCGQSAIMMGEASESPNAAEMGLQPINSRLTV